MNRYFVYGALAVLLLIAAPHLLIVGMVGGLAWLIFSDVISGRRD